MIARPEQLRSGAQPSRGLFGKLAVDNFAGWGGWGLAYEMATGRAMDVCINHCGTALKYHGLNHPATRHIQSDVWDVHPLDATAGRPVGFGSFSPDCRHHSPARGAALVSDQVRSLPWVVVKWAESASAPDVIMVENVKEMMKWGPIEQARNADGSLRFDKQGRPWMVPVKEREGETWREWLAAFRAAGYEVEHRVLNAADFGVPQNRRRLFVIGRRDGLPIRWPEPTHGPGRARPHRTAAECIDWDVPIPSIFDRPKPHAENTQKRLFEGFMRYVIDDPQPFVLTIDQQGFNGTGVASVDKPLSVIPTKARHCVCMPHMVQTGYGERKGQRPRTRSINEPAWTVPGTNKHAVGAPIMLGVGGSTFAGKPVRVDRPGNTVLPQDRRHLAVAWLAKHYTGMVGERLGKPAGTVTAVDHHAICVGSLTKFFGNNKGTGDIRTPAPTVTGGGKHIGLTLAFLMKFYGTGGQWQRLSEPLGTIPTKDRFAIVTITLADGSEQDAAAVYTKAFGWCIVLDICMRMLTPRELARCQSFPDSYILPRVGRDAVKLIGNSVPPLLAARLIEANGVGTDWWRDAA